MIVAQIFGLFLWCLFCMLGLVFALEFLETREKVLYEESASLESALSSFYQ